jgi:hypothetical protein
VAQEFSLDASNVFVFGNRTRKRDPSHFRRLIGRPLSGSIHHERKSATQLSAFGLQVAFVRLIFPTVVEQNSLSRLGAGGRWIRTCMGLFLSSGHFWFVASSLFGAGKPFFIPSPAIRFAERAEGVKGTETVAKLGGLPPSGACVSQRLEA